MPRELLIKRCFDDNAVEDNFEHLSSEPKYTSSFPHKDIILSNKTDSEGNEENRQNIGNKNRLVNKDTQPNAEDAVESNPHHQKIEEASLMKCSDKTIENNNNGNA